MKPIRVQLSRRKGWRMPHNTVSVARPSIWGNPWRVGVDGDAQHCVDEYRRLLTGQAVSAWPNNKNDSDNAMRMPCADAAADILRGKNLACWCGRGPCHADVLLEIANATENIRSLRAYRDARWESPNA